MNIIYISSACYKKNKNEIDKTAIKKLENNIINFHNSIIDGLSLQKEIKKIFSLIGLPVSKKTNKKIFWLKKINYYKNIQYIQLGFINIPILKQVILATNMYFKIKKIIKKMNKEDLIIIYDASFATAIPLLIKFAKKSNIKTIGIFADIYDYMYDVKRKSNKNIILKKIFIKKLNKAYKETTGYVFLTKDMNKLINKYSKPYIIMEGILNNDFQMQIKTDKYNKTILYSGGLNSKYGIKNLIEAVINMDEEDIKLHIYGNGELETYIRNVNNKKIEYYGVIDNEQIIKEQIKATLLINPRFSNEEYTKYSFPSKIMEYMFSGTPVLTTKLRGIPKEYYKYVYTIEDESVEGIKKAIEDVLRKDATELKEKGQSARMFIMNNKNNYIQTKKIIELLKNT